MAEKKVTTKKTTATKTASKTAVKKDVVKKETAPKAVKTEQVEATVATKPVTKVVGSLKIEVLDVSGKVVETMELPKEVFGAKINSVLMAQAVRVYLANQRLGTASTKTRGEVDGSTRKIYRQKGTGRARHGGVRAPIFVKGGIAHGPKPKDYSLSLSKHMRKAALFSALSAKVQAGEVTVMAGLSKFDKTAPMAKALTHAGYSRKGVTLFVLPEHTEKVFKAARNLAGMTVMPANQLNTYEVLKAKKVVLMQEAVAKIGVSKGAK